MSARFDAIVIGGGLIGAACAYELSKLGKKILLIEKRYLASGASGASAAMLECQIDAYRGEPFFTLSHKSNQMFPLLYEELKHETGLDFEFDVSGIVQLAYSEIDSEYLKTEVDRQKKTGLKARWLTSSDLRSEIPELNHRYTGAALYEEDGNVNGTILTRALAEAARHKGCTVLENKSDVRFDAPHGKAVGIFCGPDRYEADHYIVAAGAWTDSVLRPFGLKLGVVPLRGQLLIFDTPKPMTPYPIYTKKNGYVTPKRGQTLVGSTVEDVGFDETTTEEARKSLMGIAEDLMPHIGQKKIIGMSAGLRPGSPDGLPMIGPLAEHGNVIMATAHFRNGVLLAPITAKIVAAMINHTPSPVDPTPFSPNRSLVSA